MGVIDGRVAIITGGARGIGASISRRFAQEGASLVINDLGGGPDGTANTRAAVRKLLICVGHRCRSYFFLPSLRRMYSPL